MKYMQRQEKHKKYKNMQRYFWTKKNMNNMKHA